MRVPELPPEICTACRTDRPDHWINDMFAYCPHTRVAAVRRRLDPTWTLRKKVKPRQAEKQLLHAIEILGELACDQGIGAAELDSLIQRVRNADIVKDTLQENPV